MASAETLLLARFAVPAHTFGVRLPIKLLVPLTSPLERVIKRVFRNLVIVIDKLHAMLNGIREVARRAKLVGMPGKIDVESGDGHFLSICHYSHETVVFRYQPLRGPEEGWGV